MSDDFPVSARRVMAERVGLRCSKPNCRALTQGPRSDTNHSVNVGVAAHITAASPGGPRYDPSLSSEARRAPANGVWLCQTCAKLIDNDPDRFPVSILREWRNAAEANAAALLGIAVGDASQDWLSTQEIEILRSAVLEGDIWLITADDLRCVRSGDTDFCDPNDPAYAAEFIDALDSLQARRLVQPRGGIWYSLSAKGFKTARALVQGAGLVSKERKRRATSRHR